MKRGHRGEKGFTLIELLIVIAILGVIAAVVVPNAAGFLATGTLNAANTEVANVKTASVGFMAENEGTWPEISDDLDAYFEGGYENLKAKYTFGTYGTGGAPLVNNDGVAVGVSTINAADATITDGWGTAITWDATVQQWIRS